MRFGRLLLFLFTQVLIFACVAEIGMHLLLPFSSVVRIVLYDPLVFAHLQDFKTTEDLLRSSLNTGVTPNELNSRGFRTGEYAAAKPSGVMRIAFIGDSFTNRSGNTSIERMWWATVQSELRARGHRSLEAYGLGISGISPSVEHRIWQLEKDVLRADIVAAAVFVGNDFTDELRLKLGREQGPKLSYYSTLARLWYNYWHLPGFYRRMRLAFGMQPAEKHPGEQIPIESGSLGFLSNISRKELPQDIAHSVSILSAFRDDVESTGSRFFVILIPCAFQVEPQLETPVLLHSGVPQESYQRDRAQIELKAQLRSKNISFLDLLPAFDKQRGTEKFYRDGDTHWSDAGNDLAGRAVADFLQHFYLQKNSGS